MDVQRKGACSLIYAVAWAVLICLMPHEAFGEGLKRWAIIASNEARESGLVDLLTAELAKNHQVELAEREQLERVAAELALNSLAAHDGTGERLRIGKLLAADALLILSSADDKEGQLKVVVCDCHQGVRIADFVVSGRAESLDQAVSELTAEVKRIQMRFADGVQLVIGVSPFVSNNLEHTFDHLQSEYGDLLSQALSTQAGVAVIEVKEARAILQERLLGRVDPLVRSVPFVVNGQFRMMRGANVEPDVELTVEVFAERSSRKLPAQSVALSQVPTWIMGELATQLLAASGANLSPLTIQQQRDALIRQADAFDRLGDWKKAVGLREATLLLEPSDAQQRARLINDYRQRCTRDLDRLWLGKSLPEAEETRLVEVAANHYRWALAHLEYLVRNRRISCDEAIITFRRLRWTGSGSLSNSVSYRSFHKLPLFQEAIETERKFVIEVIPKAISLPTEATLSAVILPPAIPEWPEPWEKTLLERALTHVEYRQHDRQSLDYLAHVLIRILPHDVPTIYMMRQFLREQARGAPKQVNNAEEERRQAWLAFLQTLVESDHETARLYGRLGLFEWSLGKLGPRERRGTRDRDAIVSVMREADTILYDTIGRRPISDEVFHDLLYMRHYLLGRLDPELRPDSPKDLPLAGSLGRLRFRPIELKVTTDATQATPQPQVLIQEMLRCGDNLDAYWNEKSFYLMKEKGVLRRLPLVGHPDRSKHGSFSHVTWDGECIWLVVAGWGIYVLDANGNHLTTFSNSTPLPGIERGLAMLPLGPRRMLAIGSFGEHARAWCGILKVSADNQPTYELFHEAKRVADGRPADEAKSDAETAFHPTWIHRFQKPDGKQAALVGRSIPGLYSADRALEIDLGTLAVSVVSYETRGWGAFGAFFSRDGHLLQATGSEVYHFLPREQSMPAEERHLFHHSFRGGQRLLPHEGWIYVPGPIWRRINAQTFDVENLFQAGTSLPHPYSQLYCGVSAHYGLIGYRPYLPSYEADAPVLFQITIADEAH